ncbi:30S ribosomal subunit protein S4 [Candidatus Zinderia insecticola CARI]|uniref:Small ribosomal subunit protein uS4 n=1 Tax=Zinderia insecticola (strain CARI) TaxID=871271 RepID=E0TJ24_ZINIC|nr:30S ribosomal subunit protein S4 [Candidatus Zinderia insecticola CARI]
MARYIGKKNKIYRRRIPELFLNNSVIIKKNKKKIFKKKIFNIKKKSFLYSSNYKLQLFEKQKIKYIYGILEKQFRNYFNLSIRKRGNTAENFIKLLESRLDNIVYRMGFTNTRSEARQIVSHKFIKVNNIIVNIPSYLLKENDIVTLRNKFKNKNNIKNYLKLFKKIGFPNWIKVNIKKFEGIYLRKPNIKDINEKINIFSVIEFFSK